MLSFLLICATAILVVVDQITKIWAIHGLHHADRVIPIIEGVFELHYTENPGVAFSMLEGQRWIFIPVTIVACVAILIMMLRSPLRVHRLFNIICVLILAGAIGNLIDRIVYGFVVDFLYFKLIDFPIFNVADCFVVIGACLLFIFVLFVMKDDDDMPLRTMFFGIEKKKVQRDG